jgi:protein-tyrosine phosphatase
MTPALYPVPSPSRGRLVITARPRGGDWLEDEVRGWRRAGVDVAVSLLTPDEIEEMGLADEQQECEKQGIRFVSLPVPDRGVPSLVAAGAVAEMLATQLGGGASVAVHCRQGIGRSAVLAAAVMAALGVEPEAALRQIAEARGRPVPETPEQREWVLRFARTAGLNPAARPEETINV